MNKKLLTKRIDKVIGELVSIKLELHKAEQLEIKCEPKNDPNINNAKEVYLYFSRKRVDTGYVKTWLTTDVASTSYKNRIKSIKERLKDSTVEDAKKVIDSRFIFWLYDEKNKQYLTIETIFRPSKYYKYLDASEGILKNNQATWDDGSTKTKISTDAFTF